MAVYTRIGAEDMDALIRAFGVGTLISAKGIAEGVSNSNWLIETDGGRDGAGNRRFILTMYEERTEASDLPFFLGLLDHLAAAGCPVPRTIHDTGGASFRMFPARMRDGSIVEKAVALIEFLPGVSADNPTPAQARSVGVALAGVHLAARDFAMRRDNGMGPAAWLHFTAECEGRWDEIDPALAAVPELARDIADRWPGDLPQSVIHADLFPDNVLLTGDAVAGLIDFYFACNGAMAYDLAVTHAAWCFSPDGREFDAELGAALLAGYETVRALGDEERSALPLLAQGAALRFLLTRAYDWLHTPADALVTKKDPVAFLNRLQFYARHGDAAFAA
ncbi:homoserine kinase [Croceicoccus sp. YJ47]|uniref:homoserine kinase n=1 Tax=Croceicoccus sp. YJ47 TaxID=2798724 RepID=UPI001923DDAE|nr:homoserine kinase [Croceicoccus sp. YJ47]QQN74781.1 homoserine kinase [Croceicoccus sp. YJ47]